MTLGIIGNISVLASISHKGPIQHQIHRQSLIISSAMSDLWVCLICIPSNVTALMDFGIMNFTPDVLCGLVNVVHQWAHSASTLSLSMLALDRYLTLKRPKIALRLIPCINFIILLVWFCSLLLSLPLWFVSKGNLYFDPIQDPIFCSELWNRKSIRVSYYVINSMLIQVIPCLIVALCHISVSISLRKNKVTDMKMQKNPRHVIIISKEISVINAGNTKKIIDEDSSKESDDISNFTLKVPKVVYGNKNRSREGSPQKQSSNTLQSRVRRMSRPARSVSKIIRTHRKMRLKKSFESSSMMSYRPQSYVTRRRLSNFLLILLTIFIVCWSPYVVATLIWAMAPSTYSRRCRMICLFLGHLHSVINPVTYWIMNRSTINLKESLFNFKIMVSKCTKRLCCMTCKRSPSLPDKSTSRYWLGNSSTNVDNLGPFHPKYLRSNDIRPAGSYCTSHYFH